MGRARSLTGWGGLGTFRPHLFSNPRTGHRNPWFVFLLPVRDNICYRLHRHAGSAGGVSCPTSDKLRRAGSGGLLRCLRRNRAYAHKHRRHHPSRARDPRLALRTGGLGTLGFVLLGAAALRAGVLPRWCGVLLMVAVLGIPIYFALGNYGGAILYGLLWLALGYVLWSQRGVEGDQPSRVR